MLEILALNKADRGLGILVVLFDDICVTGLSPCSKSLKIFDGEIIGTPARNIVDHIQMIPSAGCWRTWRIMGARCWPPLVPPCGPSKRPDLPCCIPIPLRLPCAILRGGGLRPVVSRGFRWRREELVENGTRTGRH